MQNYKNGIIWVRNSSDFCIPEITYKEDFM